MCPILQKKRIHLVEPNKEPYIATAPQQQVADSANINLHYFSAENPENHVCPNLVNKSTHIVEPSNSFLSKNQTSDSTILQTNAIFSATHVPQDKKNKIFCTVDPCNKDWVNKKTLDSTDIKNQCPTHEPCIVAAVRPSHITQYPILGDFSKVIINTKKFSKPRMYIANDFITEPKPFIEILRSMSYAFGGKNKSVLYTEMTDRT